MYLKLWVVAELWNIYGGDEGRQKFSLWKLWKVKVKTESENQSENFDYGLAHWSPPYWGRPVS